MILINFEKAKAITHEHRRAARTREFEPLDDLIAKQIPGKEGAESERAAIRAKYEGIQAEIDACKSVDELQAVIETALR